MTRNSNTSLPRREFFGRVTAFGAAAACGTALPALADSNSVNASTFKTHLGESFYLTGEESEVRVKLASSDAQRHDPGRPFHVRQDPFSLIFHAPRGTEFNDQMCQIQHPELGLIEAFVSAVDRSKRNVKLQAVFG
ncbi:MAG: hypothetical protein O3C40_20800 [Planctomycetota bacterium]|nr:hypothetical protein [Planctomycetota bacterium]